VTSILVVEDEADLGRLIVRELEAAGYQVRHALQAASALEAFAESPPDLIVLDWMLGPPMDGLELLRRLRQTSPVPVLMLTARAEEVDRVVGLEVGADDYLTKPFGTRELIARVRAMLRRHDRLQEMLAADRDTGGVLRLGPLELDPGAHLARLDGQSLELTRTEFALLHLLLRNRGRAFSRAYLHDTVWGEPAVEGDRSVDNAILRLRKKLGPLGEAIETVWGVGYRLAARPSDEPSSDRDG